MSAARAGAGKAGGARAGAPRGSWRTRARAALPFAVAAAAGFAMAYLLVYLFVFPSRVVPDDRPVPDVRGRMVEDARRALEDAGFTVREGAQRVNASLPPGTVDRQSPAPGGARPRGSAVTLDVIAAP